LGHPRPVYQALGAPALRVNRRWQEDMAPYFAELSGRRPDEGYLRIAEIFHLD
jgi:L-rhamnose mutarotase